MAAKKTFFQRNIEIFGALGLIAAVIVGSVGIIYSRNSGNDDSRDSRVVVTRRWYNNTKQKVEQYWDEKHEVLRSITIYGPDGNTVLEGREYQLVGYGDNNTVLEKAVKRLPDGRVESIQYASDGKEIKHREIRTGSMIMCLVDESYEHGVIKQRKSYDPQSANPQQPDVIEVIDFDKQGKVKAVSKSLSNGGAEKKSYWEGTDRLRFILIVSPVGDNKITFFEEDGKTTTFRIFFNSDGKVKLAERFGKNGKLQGSAKFITEKSEMIVSEFDEQGQLKELIDFKTFYASRTAIVKAEKYEQGLKTSYEIATDGKTVSKMQKFTSGGECIYTAFCDVLGRIEREEILDETSKKLNTVKHEAPDKRKLVKYEPPDVEWVEKSLKLLSEDNK